MKEFSARLKQIRKSKNITQKQVAEAINLSERNYQSFEYGNIKPSFDTIVALAGYFDVSTDYLLGLTDEINSIPKSNVNDSDKQLVTELFSISGTVPQLRELINFMRKNGFNYEIQNYKIYDE